MLYYKNSSKRSSHVVSGQNEITITAKRRDMLKWPSVWALWEAGAGVCEQFRSVNVSPGCLLSITARGLCCQKCHKTSAK